MVKEKPNSTRIYDEDGFRQRAACLCVNEAESEILLVSSSRNTDQWIVPGGGVEPEESSSVAAVREVIEEAGVMGRIDRCLGVFEVSENAERRHRTVVYVLIVTEELPDWDDAKSIGRKRKWFPVDEAIELLAANKPLHLNYLKHLRNRTKEVDGAEKSTTTNGTVTESSTAPADQTESST